MKRWIIASTLPVLMATCSWSLAAHADEATDQQNPPAATTPATGDQPTGDQPTGEQPSGDQTSSDQTAAAPDTGPETSDTDIDKDYSKGQGIAFPYSLLDLALKGNIDRSGNVDYGALKGNKSLDLFIKALGTADRSQFPVWKVPPKPDDKKAVETEDHSAETVFLINAYNAFVLKTVTDAYPVNSIDDIKNFDTAKTHLLAGQMMSLAELRDEIVKREPRAFFALTSAMQGGTLLAPRAYRYFEFNELLEAAVKAFVNDPRNVEDPNRIQNEVRVNEFFTLADKLFKPKSGRRQWDGIRAVLAAYTDQSGNRRYFTSGDYKFKFFKTNRQLNKKVLQNGATGS